MHYIIGITDNMNRWKSLSSRTAYIFLTVLAQTVASVLKQSQRARYLRAEDIATEGSGKTDEMSVKMSVEMSVETNKRSIRIRKIMKAEPTITLKGIAELLGVTSRTIERTVAQMIIDGDIVHEGPKKGGIWKVLK